MTERLYECILVVEISKIVPVRANSAKEAARKVLQPGNSAEPGDEAYGESVGAERITAVRRAGDQWSWEKKKGSTR